MRCVICLCGEHLSENSIFLRRWGWFNWCWSTASLYGGKMGMAKIDDQDSTYIRRRTRETLLGSKLHKASILNSTRMSTPKTIAPSSTGWYFSQTSGVWVWVCSIYARVWYHFLHVSSLATSNVGPGVFFVAKIQEELESVFLVFLCWGSNYAQKGVSRSNDDLFCPKWAWIIWRMGKNDGKKPVKVKGIGGQHFENYNNQLMEQLLGRCFKY